MSEQALETAKREWYARIDGCPTVHGRIMGFGEALEDYAAARVAEAMKPSEEGQDFISEVLLTCLGMDKTPGEAPEVIAYLFSRRIAEARAQEREAIRDRMRQRLDFLSRQQGSTLAMVDIRAQEVGWWLDALSAEPQEQT